MHNLFINNPEVLIFTQTHTNDLLHTGMCVGGPVCVSTMQLHCIIGVISVFNKKSRGVKLAGSRPMIRFNRPQ